MMLKNLLCIAFISVIFCAEAQISNLNEIRRDFDKGIKDKDLCQRHLTTLEKNAKSALEHGYAAAYHMLMAKHSSNPIKKMSYFNAGKKKLDASIKQDPSNAELRFIRLCIQYHIPTYLGYRNNIEEDKDYLVANFRSIKDANTRELLFKYLKGAKVYTENELALLAR